MTTVQPDPTVSCRSLESNAPVPLTWVSATAGGDERRRDVWCRSVGAAVVSLTDARPVEGDSLTVVTWNTNVGGGNVALLVDKLRSGELTGGVPARDIVLLLQEVRRHGPSVPELPAGFRPPRRLGQHASADGISDSTDIIEIARALRLNLAYAPAMRNGAVREDRGNAILSTRPLDDVTLIELPMERQRRVAIAAALRGSKPGGGSWSLRVASAHFETRVGLRLGSPAAARRRQARALIDALSSSSMPTIVAGDLNTSWGDDEPAVKELRRVFPDARPTRGATWRHKPGLSAKLDYLFARIPGQKIEVHRIDDRLGSDHYPLVARISGF